MSASPSPPLVEATGSPVFAAAADVKRTTERPEIDAALATLAEHKDEWARLPLAERIGLLEEISRGIHHVAERWAAASAEAKGIPSDSARTGEEWGGIAVMLRLARLLAKTLRAIAKQGKPRLPGRPQRRGEQLVVPVYPQDGYDRLFQSGVRGEVWLTPGTTERQLDEGLGAIYRQPPTEGHVALVLAAGNYSNLAPGDVLYKLFCELQVVVLKTNPVNAYLAPLFAEAFEPVIRRGFFRIVDGGADEGAYLANHPTVAELHLTGSDKTYEAIVYGPGPEGQRRRAARTPLCNKRFTAELGNVSPVIVVPGPWSKADLAYQAEHLAAMLTLNAGFNCLSTRVIVQHADWSQRAALLDGIRAVFSRTPTRKAYYPGAERIHARFVAAHPEAELLGAPAAGQLPWTLIPGVDHTREDDVCFRSEAFCSLFAETALPGSDVPAFLDGAVDFVNDKVWGSLTATILVHPRSLKDPAVAAAVERAVARLRYGTVGVNIWGAMGFLLATPSWGAFPGHPPHDIQSGVGTVNNTFMIPNVQKSVLRGPFRAYPKPPLFPSHKTTPALFRRLAAFEASPSLGKVPGILVAAMRG